MADIGNEDNPPLDQAPPNHQNVDPETAARHGLSINVNQGIYHRGKPYDITVKLRVRAAIQAQGEGLNFTAVGKACGVTPFYVRKVWGEMLCNDGDIIDPQRIKQRRAIGPGAKTFDEMDHFVLLFLYMEEPSRSNASYVENLMFLTGTRTSSSTISRWFKDFFPIQGNFRKPNLIPADKFKPENIWKADEYLAAMSIIAPKRLRFGDEKLIKGSEVFCRKNRRNVLTSKYYAV
jgi:hypothetical protein